MKRPTVDDQQAAGHVAQLGINDPFVLYPAMSFPHKNHLRLIEATAQLRDRYGKQLTVVCSGRVFKPFWPTIQSELDRWGLTDQVRFVGPQPDAVLVSMFKRCQFVVFPSLFEGLSQALLEALEHGCPVVAADASSNAETVGEAGWLFSGFDVDAIAATLAEAMDSPERLSRMRANGPVEFRRYDWSVARRKLTALYRLAAGHSLSADEQAFVDDTFASPGKREPLGVAS
jgi:glycosyltransferase involved in cell wall biosynthesis